MGCDIQLGVERRVDGAWEYVPPPKGSDGWFPGRSYKVFARLANVRNDPGEPEVPLAEPRGVPDDLGAKMRGWWDLDQEFDFSASWFGLDELARHDWAGYAWIPEIIERCRSVGPLSEFRIVFWFSS